MDALGSIPIPDPVAADLTDRYATFCRRIGRDPEQHTALPFLAGALGPDRATRLPTATVRDFITATLRRCSKQEQAIRAQRRRVGGPADAGAPDGSTAPNMSA